MQFRQPFRRDSLSWPAAVVRVGFAPPSGAWGFAVTAAVVALCWPRRRSLAQAMTCASASFVVFLLTAKQAFLNYYWLAGALLLAAAVLQLREEVGVASREQFGPGAAGRGRMLGRVSP
jgi:predicted branched-subunit amino acid permease